MKLSLRAARVNAGYSQIQAAEKLEIAKSTLNNYENGYSSPTQLLIEKIEKLYGVEYKDIEFGIVKGSV